MFSLDARDITFIVCAIVLGLAYHQLVKRLKVIMPQVVAICELCARNGWDDVGARIDRTLPSWKWLKGGYAVFGLLLVGYGMAFSEVYASKRVFNHSLPTYVFAAVLLKILTTFSYYYVKNR